MSIAKSYLRYRLKAKTRHGVHSPFVYDIVEKVVQAKGARNDAAIENLRKALKKDNRLLEINDLGAGSRNGAGSSRTVSQIARSSATAPAQAAFLQRLATHLKCRNILELGTNLGLTTAYLASASHAERVLSIEGDEALAKMAIENLAKLNVSAEVRCGNFDDLLEPSLRDLKNPDLVYVDGNHRKEPTLRYFDIIAQYARENTLVVLGDIHWSSEMEEAWEVVRNLESVTLTVDMFYLGLVFFRKGRAREHFTLKHP
ncbi:MAG: O-methyltransferase [Cryomorphaceae bacterium]|nr:class I SAM-dependent methyltransferase [Flavobacteriales bacterium]